MPCTFSDAAFEAYGSNGACSTFSRKNQTSCEISFGGLGTDIQKMQDVLGVGEKEAEKIQLDTINRVIEYLDAARRKDDKQLTDPAFIATILTILLRGAYLRENVDTDTAKRLEQDVQEFEKGYGAKAAEIIIAGKETMTDKLSSGSTLTISPGGSVVIENEGGRVTATYSPRP